MFFLFFFFNDTATTEIYTLSLHDALPILVLNPGEVAEAPGREGVEGATHGGRWIAAGPEADEERHGRAGEDEAGEDERDRKSTRLNSSHSQISYAVFCLKKKKKCREVLTT